ncbi:hypothetical protein OIE66_05390 [Nonomuraea sp. NBC_01738]|uniref:VOC family protein n=1 Tax=Nonomuraea sp. NBC_01738 TaxID=2976003 RepID=UPI002E128782|nr:hypothetical protein OIE66_05390 [Nonomuraea sp. NBC_01738]
MSATLFVNLPVKDLKRSEAFFTALGLPFFAATEDMAAVMVSEQAQIMLLTEPAFAEYSRTEIADPTKTTQVILVLGMQNKAEVDEIAEKAAAAGAAPVGEASDDGFRYRRGFTDLDGHHWTALCLATPA